MGSKDRFAENLVKDGLITEVQLEKALKRQLLMGGKIGTNLLELNFISEVDLERALGRMFMTPPVSPDALLHIPPDVIKTIPKDIAIKHKVIPIKKELKNLTLAMENPNDIAVIDELSFMTGCRINTVVASEVRIVLALEQYYSHPRDLRYIEIKSPQEKEFVIERGFTYEDKPSSASPPAIEKEETINDRSGWLGGDAEEEPLEVTEYYHPHEAHQPEKGSPADAVREKTFIETVNKLINVDTRDEAIGTVLDYISQYFDNTIFFAVSIAEAKAWSAKCKTIDEGKISDLKINFGGPSVFLSVKNSEEPFYGNISIFPFDDEFLAKIGRERPLKVFLVPVMVKAKIVSILYIDNGNNEIPAEKIEEIKSITEKLSIAFEILLLKKKNLAKK